MINHIAGLPVHVLDDTHLIVEPGSIALWDGNPGWGTVDVEFTEITTIDMNHVGLNGRDVADFSDGCCMIYPLLNLDTGQKGFVASKATSVSNVVRPAGFKPWRKLMYGQPVVGGRCLPVHATHWPQPAVRFTDNDPMLTFPKTTSQVIELRGQWVPISLAGYIPENSRLGIFAGQIVSGLGSMWISPVPNVPNPFFKTLLKGQTGLGGDVACRVDGAQVVYVWVDGSCTAQLILRGYDMTEVT